MLEQKMGVIELIVSVSGAIKKKNKKQEHFPRQPVHFSLNQQL